MDDAGSRKQVRRIAVDGWPLDIITREQLFEYVSSAALAPRIESQALRRTITYLNIHVANTATHVSAVGRFLREVADIVYCDGRGIQWGARLEGETVPPRLTAADWLPELLALFAERGIRLFVIGGDEGVVERALNSLSSAIGPLGAIAHHHGHFGDDLTDRVLLLANAYRPDVVLVGMGTPRQEEWLLANRHKLNAPIVWSIGATFDYFGGEQARGNRLFRILGHEWIGRLLSNPRRLWRRYLIGNPSFLVRVLRRRLQRA